MKPQDLRPRKLPPAVRRFAAAACPLLLAALAAFVLAPGRRAATAAAPVPSGQPTLTAAALAQAGHFALEPEEWQDPPEATRGPVPFRLVVDYTKKEKTTVRVGKDGKPQHVRLRSYNGRLVGPTFRLAPGETLKLDLVNQLPGAPAAAQSTSVHAAAGHAGMAMGFDETNLHTHGLHISPCCKSDNVLRRVKPGETANYVFEILPKGNPAGEKPMDHYPGTFWYHAHLHGSTAVQLASGMAGAMIVAGNIDRIPEIRDARERIFVFQQLAFDKDGEVKKLDDLERNWAGSGPDDKKFTTINGTVKPRIKLRPGEVERWRLIDAGVFRLLDLSLVGPESRPAVVPFYQLAADGITYHRVVKRTQGIELAPGYRADFLVKAPETPGTYLLYNGKPRLSLTALTFDSPRAAALAEPEVLAQVEVSGAPCTSPGAACASKLLPEGTPLPAPLPEISAGEVGTRIKTVEFNPSFRIEKETFDENRVLDKFKLVKGTAEQWTVKNVSSGAHTFHIHVNAFQLVADGKPGEWRDTILIPAGKEVTFRTRLERFTGRFVLHCHILTHEDRGMMQLVDVSGPCPKMGAPECPSP